MLKLIKIANTRIDLMIMEMHEIVNKIKKKTKVQNVGRSNSTEIKRTIIVEKSENKSTKRSSSKIKPPKMALLGKFY